MKSPLLAFVVLAGPCLAQAIPLNGLVYDGAGGPLLSGSVYHIIGNAGSCGISVPAGQTLTIQPGAIVKVDGCFLVTGTLNAIGTPNQGITFTSIHDDSAGGDTNGNGTATSPAPGDWVEIDMGGSVTCEWAQFRYGGGSNRAALALRNQPQVFRDCSFGHLVESALGGAQQVTVERCAFHDLGTIPVVDLALRSITQFVDNTAVRCAGGEYARITDGRLFAGNMTMDPRYSINSNGVFVFKMTNTVSPRIPFATHWTLPAGTVFKFDGGLIRSDGGRLITQGIPTAPVIMTSLADDTVGGDTENDGSATAPAPADWIRVALNSGDTSTLQHTELRYAGNGTGALQIDGSSAVVDHVSIAHSGSNAVSFGNLAAVPTTITNCAFRDNTGLPFYDAQWAILANATGNTATGNAAGNHFRVLAERPTTAISLTQDNFPGDVLEVGNKTTIQSGGTLSLPAGTILKFPSSIGSGFTVNNGATLNLRGTARRPIVLTSYRDDSFGGDTNGDGNATIPAPNDIRRVFIGPGSTCRMENVLLRYGGANTVESNSPSAILRRVRVEHSSGTGFRIADAQGDVDNLVAFDCATTGIELNNRSYNLRHATAVNCGGAGIRRTGIWTGQVINSISWGNGINFDSVPPAQIFNTNGDGAAAGTNGNINVAPQFVNAAGGDLQLQAGSPCIDRADQTTAIAVGSDHDEFPRVLNDTLSGATRADLGAYERFRYAMIVGGAPTLGGTIDYTIQGPGGLGTFLLGFAPSNFFLAPFGVYLAGLPNDLLPGTPVAMGGQASLFIPNNPAFLGAQFAVQGLGFQLATLQGGFTNVDREIVR